MASMDNKNGKTEMRELTPIQKILNTMYESGKVSGEYHTVAQQQYDNLCGRLRNLKEIYPKKYDVIKTNASKRKRVPELSTMKDELKVKCPGLMKVLQKAVELKEDQDGSARRELLMLVDADYMEPHTRQKAEHKKEILKHGSPPPQQIDRRIDPNIIRMTTLWEFISEKQNMSVLRISDKTAKLAREKYQELKYEWETILNKEDKKVRDFLNSRSYNQKKSLSLLKIDAEDPLHIVMVQLSNARRIFSQKDDIIYEYVTLVDVCNAFRHHTAHTTKHVQSEAPSEKHLSKEAPSKKHSKTPTKLKSVERTGPQESEVDCRSHLENLLQTYLEDKNVDEDDKERSRQEFMNLVTLRDKYGTTDDHVSKDDQVEEDKLENLVTEDQRGQAKGLYAVLRYAKEKGLEKWHWAAAEFSRLTDFVKGLGKTQEDHGARPKIPSEDTKEPPLFQLISSCKETDPTLRRKALDQYRKLRRKARELPSIRAEQNLAQSMSRLCSPAEIPDDEQSSSYYVLQILRAADPDAKKYSAAWEEYFYLLAEEQRFVQIINAREEYKHREHIFHPQAPNAQEPFQNLDFDNQVQLPPTDQAAEMSSFVQAPCERQPQRNLGKEGLISMPVTQWKAVLDELDRKTQEVEDLSSRLSRFASQQLTSGNPNIADLSDRNRPTKIGEMFGQLYDNEWSDAFDSLKKSMGNVTNETMSASPKSDKVGKKELKKSRQKKDHSMRRELPGDRSNEKETVIQEDHLSKSQKQSTRREDENKLDDNRSGDDFNDVEGINVNKDVDAASSVREKKKTVAENIKKSTQTLVEKGGEGDGVESKQDIPDENSKEQAEQNIEVREHSDKERAKCEGAEGGKDEERKEVEEDDFNMKELTILQGIVMAAYEFSIEQAALQLKKLEADIADVITLNTSQANSNPSSSYIEADKALRKECRAFASQEAKDFRKMVGTLSYKMAAKIFETEKLPHLTENCPTDSAIVEYGNKCVELTWFMVIQDPPMKLVCPKQGEKFKKTEFAYHGRKGKVVELCVWPALYLYDGGPMVNKGHVLPALEASI